MIISGNLVISILMLFVLVLFTGLLLHIGRHTLSNIYLAVYFISQIVGISYSIFHFNNEILVVIVQSVHFTWAALFYLYVKSLLNPLYTFRKSELYHFIPLIFSIFLFLYIFFPSLSGNFYKPQRVSYTYSILGYLFNLLLIGYNVATFAQYLVYRKKNNNLNHTQVNAPRIWILISVLGFMICSAIVLLNQQPATPLRDTINNGVFLAFFCVLFYTSIVCKTLTNTFVKKYGGSKLEDTEALAIIKKLTNEIELNKAYTNPDMSIKIMAQQLNVSERHLSQAVNSHLGQNFSEYINICRVKYAMSLLATPNYKDCTMLAILADSGFNSKTTFNVTFKKVAGCTPLEYKKRMEQVCNNE
jgi:AraC-like DNA-binding protein